ARAVRRHHVGDRRRPGHLDDLLDAPHRAPPVRRAARPARRRDRHGGGRGRRHRVPRNRPRGPRDDTAVLRLGAGLATSVVIGVLLYVGAVRINLSKFFTVSGVLLIFVAAGIFKYAIHDFQEAGVLPGLSTHAYDASAWLDPSSWYGAVVSGLFNITPQP